MDNLLRNMENFEKLLLEKYDPNEDIKKTGGIGGIRLADKILIHKKELEMNKRFSKEKGKDYENLVSFDYSREQLNSFLEIFDRGFRPFEMGESVSVPELKRKFVKLRRAGYNFPKPCPYNHLNQRGLIRYYYEIESKIRELAFKCDS